MSMNPQELQKILDEKGGGLLYSGGHSEDEAKLCALELDSVARGRSFSGSGLKELDP